MLAKGLNMQVVQMHSYPCRLTVCLVMPLG